MLFDTYFAIQSFPDILKGVPMTLLIAVVAMLLGLINGLVLTLCRIYKVPVLKELVVVYISFIRGTPLLVQIYVIYYSLPLLFTILSREMGWDLSANNIPPLAYALTAFTINTTAYMAETIRAAFRSVEAGQMEAAYSVGLTTVQSLRRIIIPQAMVVALPNLANMFLGLIKGTSLAYSIMVVEILAQAKLAAADGYRYLEAYVDAAIIYWILCLFFERLFSYLEKRVKQFKGEITPV